MLTELRSQALFPDEAERLTHAAHSGKLRLVLRSVLDNETVELGRPTTSGTLIR